MSTVTPVIPAPVPIGTPIPSSVMAPIIADLVAGFDKLKPLESWFVTHVSGDLYPAVVYLIGCIDNLVLLVDDLAVPGADKKATILNALGQIYDNVLEPLEPLWMVPENALIRSIVLNIVCGAAIDFVMSKYADTPWSPIPDPTPLDPSVVPAPAPAPAALGQTPWVKPTPQTPPSP